MTKAPETEKPAEPVRYRSEYKTIRYPEAPNGPIDFVAGSYETTDQAEIDYLDKVDTASRA